MEGVRAERVGDRLVLETGAVRREYLWNDGHLIGLSLEEAATGYRWALAGDAPDLSLPGEAEEGRGGALEVADVPATPQEAAHTRAAVTCRLGDLEVRRVFRLYPGCPAIACDVYLRGRPAAERWIERPQQAGALGNIEDWRAVAYADLVAPVVERLAVPQRHLRVRAVRFYDITDRRNNLVEERAIAPYRAETRLAGNLLLVVDRLAGQGLFILKEAPCSDVALAYPGCDYAARIGLLQVAGIGLEPGDLAPECAEPAGPEAGWVRGYGFVTGAAAGGEAEVLEALRAYQEMARPNADGREDMIMLNTWGDRGQDTKIREAFALAEVRAGSRLGVSHFQLDDGWQAGQSSNSAYAGGSLVGIWERDDYWAPHPERFPRGLGPAVEAAREAGLALCLWYNPSTDDSFAHWEDDARQLVRLYREHGVRVFKIDGTDVPDKRADRNLRAMFDRVIRETRGEVSFNIDTTAKRRFGYHYMPRYGNLFLENRYTDWSNYYPHWTLRNLWTLARYLPAQRFQIEFLNVWRNAERYPEGDPLAPREVPFEYAFAVTMMAQPLAWFESQHLPEAAFAAAGAIRRYREHQRRIHAGRIWPIGEEPSGLGWTGFQSVRADGGYLAIYRERTERASARMRLRGAAGRTLIGEPVIGRGAAFRAPADGAGEVEFALPAPFTYALYAYTLV